MVRRSSHRMNDVPQLTSGPNGPQPQTAELAMRSYQASLRAADAIRESRSSQTNRSYTLYQEKWKTWCDSGDFGGDAR